jgi:hypothetical protein
LASSPDIIVFVPPERTGPEAENQHFLVVPSHAGIFLAFWTQASVENHPNQRVVMSRSTDQGQNWSKPEIIAGSLIGGPNSRASWGFPFVVPSWGRIYIFWNQQTGAPDAREDTTGALSFRVSEDDGLSWSETRSLTIRKGTISNSAPGALENWIVYQPPIVTSRGVVIAGFTRWASGSKGTEGGLYWTNLTRHACGSPPFPKAATDYRCPIH